MTYPFRVYSFLKVLHFSANFVMGRSQHKLHTSMEIQFLKEPFVVGRRALIVSSRLIRKPFVVRLILTWGVLCPQTLTRDPFVLRAILKPIISRLWDNRGLFHAQDYFLCYYLELRIHHPCEGQWALFCALLLENRHP